MTTPGEFERIVKRLLRINEVQAERIAALEQTISLLKETNATYREMVDRLFRENL